MTSFWVRDYQGPSNAGRRPDPHIVRNVIVSANLYALARYRLTVRPRRRTLVDLGLQRRWVF